MAPLGPGLTLSPRSRRFACSRPLTLREGGDRYVWARLVRRARAKGGMEWVGGRFAVYERSSAMSGAGEAVIEGLGCLVGRAGLKPAPTSGTFAWIGRIGCWWVRVVRHRSFCGGEVWLEDVEHC